MTTALQVIAVLAVLFFMKHASSLLIPIALAALLSYALGPIVAWLERHRLPRIAAAALVMLVILGGAAYGGYVIKDDAREFAGKLPQTIDKARAAVGAQLGMSGIEEQQGGPVGTAGESSSSSGGGGMMQRAASMAIEGAGQLVVVFFLTAFLLALAPMVRERIIEVAASDQKARRNAAAIVEEINGKIQRYLLVLLFTGAVVGVSTWLVLMWMGVEHAATWGILAGVFNSIPYFGPVIVCGGLFLVGLLQNGDATMGLQMAGAALVITSLEGWLLTPALMGKAERMNALAVFLGLLLFTWVWGAWGTILAVPMLVVIKSVADHVQRLKPVGRLMAP